MAKKTETVYAPFLFALTDLIHWKPVHEGQTGCLLVFKDQYAAYEEWDKLKQTPGIQMSAFGCGSDETQHVYMPIGTGMLQMKVPQGLIPDDQHLCVMSAKLPLDATDIQIKREWIKQIDIRIEGDVAHSPIMYTQISEDGPPEYSQLQALAQYRFNDLMRICEKLATDTQETLKQADIYDDHARDALCAMYCGNGLAHRRFFLRQNMTEAQKRLESGLEYLQPYLHAMDKVLGINSILRHAYSMEQEFRDMYPQYDSKDSDARITAATTVAAMMHEHAERSLTHSERTAFLSLKTNAEQDVELFKTGVQAYDNTSQETLETHEPMDCDTVALDDR